MSQTLPKISYVVPYKFLPPRNGGQNAAYFFSAFIGQSHPLMVLSTSDNNPPSIPYDIYPVLSRHPIRYVNIISWFSIFNKLSSFRPDYCLVHQHFIFFLFWPITSILGIPIGIYVQNIEYQRFRSMRKWWWPIIYASEWISYRLADGLFFISPADIDPAKKNFRLKISACFALPFGTDKLQDVQGQMSESDAANPERLILFYGPLSYQPNLEALNTILKHIEPEIRTLARNIRYKLIICGGGLPQGYSLGDSPFVSYLGYVDDIESLVRSSHVMINPVTKGGGVKTKVIESIAWGTSVVSSRSGALGIDVESCGEKLIVVDDNDYKGYAQEIVRLMQAPKSTTSSLFYKNYYWGNIADQFIIDLKQILLK